MLTAPQLRRYFLDLRDRARSRARSRSCTRGSRRTPFPSWELAHPYRLVAHNGEFNTLRGNANWMGARESQLASELFGDDLAKVLPVIRPGGSDSATFDNVLELLVLSGRSLPHALMMMMPEAHRPGDLSPELEAFYAYHGCLIEPWDGPAALAFTDGRVIGATLDRNGLRPGRWLETSDGWVVLASEAGCSTCPRAGSCGRAGSSPESSSSSTSPQGRIVPDDEVKRDVARRRPYRDWFERNRRAARRSAPARRPCPSPSRCAACSWRSATRRRT